MITSTRSTAMPSGAQGKVATETWSPAISLSSPRSTRKKW
jgi:hypothetical protein